MPLVFTPLLRYTSTKIVGESYENHHNHAQYFHKSDLSPAAAYFLIPLFTP